MYKINKLIAALLISNLCTFRPLQSPFLFFFLLNVALET